MLEFLYYKCASRVATTSGGHGPNGVLTKLASPTVQEPDTENRIVFLGAKASEVSVLAEKIIRRETELMRRGILIAKPQAGLNWGGPAVVRHTG